MTEYGNSQFIDKYGINIGASYSTQYSNFKLVNTGVNRQDYKIGLQIFIESEKKINNLFSLQSEIGYIQKGYKYVTSGFIDFAPNPGPKNNKLTLHDLALDFGLKITPSIFKQTPYVYIGLRGDYMVSNADMAVINQYNKANIGGMIGIGIDFKDKYYMELDYNPTFTISYNSDLVSYQDNCWGIKFGININKLIKK